MLNFGLGLLVTALMKETYFKFRSKPSSNTVLGLLRNLMEQTLQVQLADLEYYRL